MVVTKERKKMVVQSPDKWWQEERGQKKPFFHYPYINWFHRRLKTTKFNLEKGNTYISEK